MKLVTRAAGAAVALAATTLIGASSAAATTLTFDDLPGAVTPVPAGYNGLDWNNFASFDGKNELPQSGYLTGQVSKPIILFNLFGAPASIVDPSGTFTFDSVFLTGAWNDGLQIQMTGKNGATSLFSITINADTSGPTEVTADWAGLTELDFTSSGGTENPALVGSGNGTQFAMDNLTINAAGGVPEPASWAMTLLGAGMIGAGLRLSRRKGEAPTAA